MYIYYCDRDFASMMTCIYTAWASKKGHDNVRLEVGPIGQQELFSEYIYVPADEEKAESVIRTIKLKISEYAYRWVFYAAMSQEPDALDAIYRFLILGFKCGPDTCKMLQHPEVARLMELNRRVGNEAHLFREFLRFSCVESQNGRMYVAHIEPESDVLFHLAEAFTDRMGIENWVIVDDNRKRAVIHPANEQYYFSDLSPEEFARLKQTEDSDLFAALWKTYFESIAIMERVNPVCQRTHFPVWMRKHAVEFLEN